MTLALYIFAGTWIGQDQLFEQQEVDITYLKRGIPGSRLCDGALTPYPLRKHRDVGLDWVNV